MRRTGETVAWFRVWHTWASWAKKGVGSYLNIAHKYGYTYPVTQVSGFQKQARIHIYGVSDTYPYPVHTKYRIRSKAAVSTYPRLKIRRYLLRGTLSGGPVPN
jgi:hypothetical protein